MDERTRQKGESVGIPDSGSSNGFLPPAPAHVHFVGVGGIGMSGLARILNVWGYAVSGSDTTPSPLLQELAAEGIAVTIGHHATGAASTADLVVATAAVGPDNPEVAAAHAAGRPVIKRARLLGELAGARRSVAVAGSHGKSTTSGMLVSALRDLGADPSFAIGAVLDGPLNGTNAAPGTGSDMVVEADEYDWSFLQLHPDVAIITNVDYDHPDLFPDQMTYDAAFVDFVGGMHRDGTLVMAADDPVASASPADLTGRHHGKSSRSANRPTRTGGWSRRRKAGGSSVLMTSLCRLPCAFRGDITYEMALQRSQLL